jgi:predicted transcriptional regulator
MPKQGLIPLNTKRVITFALIFIVIGCFMAQLYQQKNSKFSLGQQPVYQLPDATNLKPMSFDTYFTLASSLSTLVEAPSANAPILANSTRSQIYDYIIGNPGVQFRALCSALCLPVGLAEYHLGVLIRSGLVSFVRDGRYKRFFISKQFSKREILAICLLRHKTVKRIIETLLCKKQLSHGSLAGEVAITSQALTWQMKTLRNTEFVLQVNDGLRTVYSLDESRSPTLVKCLAVVG